MWSNKDEDGYYTVELNTPHNGKKVYRLKEDELLKWNPEDNQQENKEQALENAPETGAVRFSDVIDENGRQFILTSEGEVEFGIIGDETGLTPAPILLSEGMITNPQTNDGYGLVHIEARHGEQIRKAGYKDVVSFIEEVAKNWDVIKEGNLRKGVQTYRLQLIDRHNNTLMVELSGDGTYWNINTAGIFKKSYGANSREVYNRHTTKEQSAETAEESQGSEQSSTQEPSSINSPKSSPANKDSDNQQENKQSALERIQKGDDGKLLYESSDKDTVWDAFVEQAEGDEAIALTVANQMLERKKEALKKIGKKKLQDYAKGQDLDYPDVYFAAEKARKAAIAKAQEAVDFWQSVVDTPAYRKIQAESEAREQAEKAANERREREMQEAARKEEQERLEREALEGVPDVTEDKPADARSRGYRRVGGALVERQKPINAVKGKEVSVKFSEKTTKAGRVVIVSINDLQPSHTQGLRNPLFFIDEAQPKDRKDNASQEAARKIAANIRPEEITSSVTAYTGAPTINERGELIQGNNRTDGLKVMYQAYPEQAEAYKEYLKQHATEFGLTAEQIDQIENPVLVNMLEVSDDEAITLGQYSQSDIESGGIERIKAGQTIQKMGADMSNFVRVLMNTEDDELSLSALISQNARPTLSWLAQRGYISNTQFNSALNSKGDVTGDAQNDLKEILYNSIFQGASSSLKDMFEFLPVKAQRSILATAYRDYDSPQSERMIEEIQNSIMAFYSLMQSKDFAEAKDYKAATIAADEWAKQYAIDDVTYESYLPSERFSNFAVKLAITYKIESQRSISDKFNRMFDLVQGIASSSLFEEVEDRKYTLSEAIKQVLEIDYNGKIRSNVLGSDLATSEAGERGSTTSDSSGERVETGTGQTDNRRRVSTDSEGAREESAQRENKGDIRQVRSEEVDSIIGKSLSEEEANHLVSLMEAKAEEAPELDLTPENWVEQFGEDSKVETPIGQVKMGDNQLAKLFKKGRESQFGMIKPTLEHPQIVIEVKSESKEGDSNRDTSYLFIKTFKKEDGSKYTHFESVTLSKDGLEVSISSHILRENQLKNRIKSGKLLYKATALDESANPSAEQLANEVGSPSPTNKDSDNQQENNTLTEKLSVFDTLIANSKRKIEVDKGSIKENKVEFSARIRVDGKLTDLYIFDYEGATPNEYGIGVRYSSQEATYNELGRLADEYNKSAGRRAAIEGADELGINFNSIDDAIAFSEWVASQNTLTVDNQGNSIDSNGNLVIEKISSISDLTDEDFTTPMRSVELPKLPKNVADAIGSNGKPVVIKKSIFKKNAETHKELTAEDSRRILNAALNNPNLVGQTQPKTRPDYKVAIQTGDKNSVVVLDVYQAKDNVEVVGWRMVDQSGLERMKKQAEREGGQFLILSPQEGSAAALSTLPNDLSSNNKGSDNQQKNNTREEKTSILEQSLQDSQENKNLAEQAKSWAIKQFGIKANSIHIITDVSQIPANQVAAREAISKGLGVTAWVNGDIYIYLPNILISAHNRGENALDNIKAKVFHELVAHKNLKEMLGAKGFSALMGSVWNDVMSEADKAKFIEYHYTHNLGSPKGTFDSLSEEEKKQIFADPTIQEGAADEFVAHFAEKKAKGILSKAEQSTWDKILALFKEILNKIGLRNLTERDLENIILASYQYSVNSGNSGTELNSNNRFSIEGTTADAQKWNVSDHLAKEMAEIKAKALQAGSFMKAPNGEQSNLDERNWLLVRTNAFKKWFGDWELMAQEIEKVAGDINHGFKNFDEALAWAKANIVGTLSNEQTGGKGEIRISTSAVSKFLSESAIKKSDNKDVHLATLKVLPYIIRTSIDAEQHTDRLKGKDGKRSEDNGINENVTIHRLYGAVEFDGKIYRVKVTIKADKSNDEPNKAYSYEATKIELLAGQSGRAVTLPRNSNNSISATKLLNDVEKTNGERFFSDVSKVVDRNGEPLVVAHSTNASFSIFAKTQQNDAGWLGEGYYFFGDRSLDGQYGSNIIEAFLNIRDPYYATSEENSRLAELNDNNVSKDYREEIENDGYDGIYYNGDLNQEYVAFYPNQIKSASENFNISNDDDIRFSIEKPIEEKGNLIALHNLNEASLEKALELGGFPMPSIAVTKMDIGHTSFGEISLVFGKDTIDPTDRRNKIYTADAWTPTFPETRIKINDNQRLKINDTIKDLLADDYERISAFGLLLDSSNMEDTLNRNGGDFVSAYKRNIPLKVAFLKHKGLPFKPVQKEIVYSEYGNDTLKKIVRAVGEEKIVELRNADSDQKMAIEPQLREVVDEYCNKQLQGGVQSIGDIEEGRKLYFSEVDKLIYDANRLLKGGDRKEIDTYKTEDRLNAKFTKKLQQEFESWLNDLSTGIIEKRGIRNETDLYTPSGNRRKWEALYDDVTLYNVVKAMQRQAATGGQGFFSNSIFGAAQAEIGSIDELRKLSKSKLQEMPDEDMFNLKDEITNKLGSIQLRMTGGDSSFSKLLDAKDSIIEAVSKSKTPKGIYRELKPYYNAMTMTEAEELAAIAKEIQAMPTKFFEAKPYRAVRFDELKLAVVPKGTSADIVESLESKGILVKTYKKGDNESRKKVLNTAVKQNGLRFSIEDNQDSQEYSRRYRITDTIEELFEEAVNGKLTGKPISIGQLSANGKMYLESISGIKLKDKINFVLNPSDLRHIYDNHFGKNEKDTGNNIPLSSYDIRRMIDVISFPDTIVYGVDDKGRKTFSFLLENPSGTYNLFEVYADSKGNLTAKTYYKTKKGVSQRAISLKNSLHSTSETDGATLFGAKIPQIFESTSISQSITSAATDLAKALNLSNIEVVENADSLELQEPTKEQQEATELVMELLGDTGIEVSTDVEEMAEVYEANERLSEIQKEALGTASSSQAKYQQTVVSSADGAKILNNLNKAASTIREWVKNGTRNKSFEIHLPTYVLNRVRAVMGRDFDSHNITSNSLSHILKEHGINGTKVDGTKIPITSKDLELIPYIMTAPDKIQRGSIDNIGKESVRFYKTLSNGYVVVVEKEQKNSPDDMETITMWAELSSSNVPDARTNVRPLNSTSQPAITAHSGKSLDKTTARTVIISSDDIAKIQQDAEKAIQLENSLPKITDHIQFLKTNKGEVLGFVKNGKIYLDGTKMNPNTPIHEYTHLWDRALMQNNPELWERGVELMKQAPLWEEMKNDPAYADIADNEDLLASEVHARLSGAEGATLMEQWVKDSKKGDVFTQADKVSLVDSLRRWIKQAWQWVKDTMAAWTNEEASKVSLEEFINMPIKDLVEGKKLNDYIYNVNAPTQYSIRTKPAPKNTNKAYKLFKVDKQGRPHALFIDSANPVDMGVWLDADSPNLRDLEKLDEGFYLIDANGNAIKQDKKPTKKQVEETAVKANGSRYMNISHYADGTKKYENFGINGSGSVGVFALRPGWHITNAPSARHIGAIGEDGKTKSYRRPDERWFEVEYAADVDYNAEAKASTSKAKGIDSHIPEDGYYEFQTNSNANPNQSWIISGAMRIVRPLSESEAHKISRSMGIEEDLPYKNGVKNFEEVDGIKAINDTFNEQLQQQIDGNLPKGHIYRLGAPSDVLRSAGVVDLPIELSSQRLQDKSNQTNHPFSISNLKDLPNALNNPIAVFDSRTKEGSKVILTELKQDDNNFVVVLRIRRGQNELEVDVNDIRSLYPKDRVGGIAQWIISGLLRYVDKKKLTDFITQSTNLIGGNNVGKSSIQPSGSIRNQALIDQQRTNLADVEYLDLESVTKVVENFQNPKLEAKEDIKAINDTFNDQLQQQIDGTLPKDHIYQLGRPNQLLHSTGIPNIPIELSASRLLLKSNMERHQFDLSDLRDLPNSLRKPIAVFEYGDKSKAQNLILEIQHNGKNYLVGIHFNQNRRGIVVSDIRSIFPKDNAEWLNWIAQGKLLYADKTKIQALIDKQRMTFAEVDYLDLDSIAKVINDFQNPKLEAKDDIRFRDNNDLDQEYLDAVNRGDMGTAQRMVNEAAAKAGYNVDSDYQGTSAFNGAAPNGEGYYENTEERRAAFDDGNFEGDWSLGDAKVSEGYDGGLRTRIYGNEGRYIESVAHRSPSNRVAQATLESRDALRKLLEGSSYTITMYRSVPADVKEGSFRNGDWITPSRTYAIDNAIIHGFEGYHIIEQEVSIDDVWWDGNDINEWGYNDGKGYSYQNTPNNRKLLDAVTYDNNGNVIPLSKRFDTRNSDTRYRYIGEQGADSAINATFNEQLQQQIDGTLPKGYVYELGLPSEILQSTGIPNISIKLQSSVLNEKSNDPAHPYQLSEIKDLVKLIQEPIAIFPVFRTRFSEVP